MVAFYFFGIRLNATNYDGITALHEACHYELACIVNLIISRPIPLQYIPTVQPHLIHFARAITLAWVGLLGSLWYILVEEDLKFFLRYHGSIWVDGKVVKNQVKN